jgi:hypothetical protein
MPMGSYTRKFDRKLYCYLVMGKQTLVLPSSLALIASEERMVILCGLETVLECCQ